MFPSSRRLLAALGSSLLVLSVATGPAAAAAPVSVTVSAATASRVDAGFAGFSYEKDRVGAGMFDAHDQNEVRLFRLLGPSVLRIGGNLVDMVSWNPHGAGGSATEIAPADVTKLAAFARDTGWKVIYGINLKTNTAAGAASEAAFAAHALGRNLMAFEIGNEPNEYTTESAYETSFNAYVDAIRAQVPNAAFDGPGEADSTQWAATFAAHEKNHGLALLSTHLYIGNQTTGTLAGLMASNASGRLPTSEAAMRRAQLSGGVARWRMTETNSYYHGGKAGVSDVEAAAVWSLEYMAGVAGQHGEGVNFHGGTSTQFPLAYSPIVYSGLTPTGVQGVYYGELLWHLAGTGPLHTATVTGSSDAVAWAIGSNVFVTNKGGAPIQVKISLPTTAHHADEYVMTAPSPTSKAITIAGSAVGAGAAFTPKPARAAVSGRTVTVDVPAGSAVLVRTR